MTSNETLAEWTSGEGHVRRRDGRSVGSRRYDIEVWQIAGGTAGGGQADTRIKASIEFSEAERQEFMTQGTELTLTLEDGREFGFILLAPNGVLVAREGRPKKKPPNRALALAVLSGVVMLIYLGQRFEFTSGVSSTVFSAPIALPAIMISLALATVAAGMGLAPRRRHRGYFMFGVFVVALGIVSLWALPEAALAIARTAGWSVDTGQILAVVAMFVGGGVLIIDTAPVL
jgi:hypothetical protein